MSLRRAAWFAATVLATLVCVSCGEVYRPVVIPCSAGQLPGCPQQTNPNPANFHSVFALSANVPSFPGTAQQIDVSGDSVIAATANDPGGPNIGVNPTYATILPNNSRIFVASAGSLTAGFADIVTTFSPAFDSTTATGFGTVSTYSLPAGSLPVFVHTTENTTVYVANYGTNSVTALNANTGVVDQTTPVGSQPVALAETPDGTKLYVVNRGDNTVQSLSTVDLLPTATLTVGTAPVWAVSRVDGQRIYVVTEGDGKLYTIRTDTDALISPSGQSVGGPGANYAIYDSNLNRIYVINPNVAAVFAFDATTDPPTSLGNANGIGVPAPPVTGIGAVVPVSVAALPDGSRFYVASYVVAAGACQDATVTAANCIIPQATVFDAASLTFKSTIFPLLSPASSGAQPFAVAPVTSCISPVYPALYAPGTTRFRLSSAAATDSSRVYVGMCDAGSVAVINTVTSSIVTGSTNPTDNLVMDLNAPFSAATAGVNSEPPPQNPILLFTGQ
jgi:YVTN family beta-propeller protein